MADCIECGKPVVTGEPFCSNCGTKHPVASDESNEVKESQESKHVSGESAAATRLAASPADESSDTAEPSSESSEGGLVSEDSTGGSATGESPIQAKHTIKKGN